MFIEAGIPIVISVCKDLLIEDSVAKQFAVNFYLELCNDHTIGASFKTAQISVQKTMRDQNYTCCCAHKHDSGCEFCRSKFKHEDHAQLMECACKHKGRQIHKDTCGIAVNYIDNFLYSRLEKL